MADLVTVSGVRPYDGRYELELGEQPLTTREWGFIKRYAGYLPATLDADTFGDPELITVLALIAMRRAGAITAAQVGEVWERFADAPFGSAISYEADPAPVEDDAGPPAASSNGSPSTSSASSPTASASSDEPPSPTGSPASDGSEWRLGMSVS